MSNLNTKLFNTTSYFIPAGSVPFRSAPVDRC